jgi:hypothetical protein
LDPQRRKEDSERMAEWNDYDRDDRVAPDYYDPKKKDWIDGAVDPDAYSPRR